MLALPLLALPSVAPAQSPASRSPEITSELRLAIGRGLDYLVKKQTASGDIDSEYSVAVNALAGLAFLSSGHTYNSGPKPAYSRALRLTTEALLRRQRPSGYFDDGQSLMYGHGFATLYLAELFGTMPDDDGRIQNALRSAIRLIERSQGRDGGWDYCPEGECQRSFGGSDTSITVCQTMALRAARNLGIAIDASVLKSARRFIERAQNDDGGFRYRFGPKSELPLGLLSGSQFPRSAAGVCILYSLGDYNSQRIRDGFRYIEKRYRSSNLFPYYGHYYCAQAMFQVGGRAWREYFTFIRAELLRIQKRDGSWRSKSERENSAQATAMALIVLQLPYRLLPIHER